jgi:hypothetical protein
LRGVVILVGSDPHHIGSVNEGQLARIKIAHIANIQHIAVGWSDNRIQLESVGISVEPDHVNSQFSVPIRITRGRGLEHSMFSVNCGGGAEIEVKITARESHHIGISLQVGIRL